MAGQLPRNHRYAGAEFPRERLPAAYRDKGLKITERGHPDFSPYAQRLPNGQMSVRIKMTGNYAKDVQLANKAAKIEVWDPNMAWHHVEDGMTMQLIPKDLHNAARHSGGRATYKHRTGDASAYP